MLPVRLLSAAMVLLLSAPVSAADAESESNSLQEIVVIASRVPQSLSRVATSVSTLDRSQVETHGNLSLQQILRQMPAIGGSSNGGPGATSALRIRGEEGFRTLYIVDGLRLADPSNTQVTQQPEHLLSAGVERIEVLRGPQGLAYGADAGGVIQVSSLNPEPGLGLSVNAEAGSQQLRQYDLQLQGAGDDARFALGASRMRTEGINQQVADTVLQDRDGYRNRSLHGTLGVDITRNVGLQWTGRQVRGRSEFDGCFAGFTTVHDCLAEYRLDAGRLALHADTEQGRHELSWARVDTRRGSLAQGQEMFAARGRSERWEYLGTTGSGERWQWVYGADLERLGNGEIARNNLGLFGEAILSLSADTTLTAGLRRDDNDDFGRHLSWRVSAAKILALDGISVKLRGSAGTGFRAPSLYEQDYNLGDFATSPAAGLMLQEEQSHGYEFGVDLYADNWQLQATWFDQSVKNSILFDLSSFSGYLQDRGDSYSRGLELAGQWSLTPAWLLSANYTFNDTWNRAGTDTGQSRLRRPRHLANAGLVYSSDGGRLQVAAFYRASRDAEDEEAGNRIKLDDINVVDVNLGYRLSGNIRLFLRVENLANAHYQEVRGFRSLPRAWFAGFRADLRL